MSEEDPLLDSLFGFVGDERISINKDIYINRNQSNTREQGGISEKELKRRTLASLRSEGKDLLYVFHFAVAWEKFFQPFDDYLISKAQAVSIPGLYFFNLGITIITSIEFSLPWPFIAFICGADTLGLQLSFVFLTLATISQIPKRFIWRTRPYLVDRAKKVRPDKSSSFPSRAVTCSVVYTWAVFYLLAGLRDAGVIFGGFKDIGVDHGALDQPWLGLRLIYLVAIIKPHFVPKSKPEFHCTKTPLFWTSFSFLVFCRGLMKLAALDSL